MGRLEVPRLGIREPVLSGATGSTLAFGIGHVDGSALPGTPGHTVLAGHRDRQLAFLAALTVGDEVILRTHAGHRAYRVGEMRVVGAGETSVLEAEPDAPDQLTLITCYPFGGVLPAHLRAVVRCTAQPREAAAPMASAGTGTGRAPARASRRRSSSR
jgi:sortase A